MWLVPLSIEIISLCQWNKLIYYWKLIESILFKVSKENTLEQASEMGYRVEIQGLNT